MVTQKKKAQVPTGDNVIEQMRDLGGGVAQSFKTDLVGGVITGALTELFSPNSTSTKKDLQPGEEIFFPKEAPVAKQPQEMRKLESIVPTNDEVNLVRDIEAVRYELKKVMAELKDLNNAAIEVEKAVAQAPVKFGKYHFSFFSRLKEILKVFRQQISDSRIWLEESFNKKKKRQFWCMFKKHGTSYGLSSERVVATSIG